MKSNSFKEYIQPTVVLVAICLVITFALAYVNSITAPIIAENSAKAADAARAELLPAATSLQYLTRYLSRTATLRTASAWSSPLRQLPSAVF